VRACFKRGNTSEKEKRKEKKKFIKEGASPHLGGRTPHLYSGRKERPVWEKRKRKGEEDIRKKKKSRQLLIFRNSSSQKNKPVSSASKKCKSGRERRKW